MTYLIIIGFAFALFVLLRILQVVISKLVVHRKARKLFSSMFPFIELTLWLVFFFWVFHWLFYELPVYQWLTGSLIIVVVAILGWYLLRDLISGVILKAEHGFEPGQRLMAGEVSGTIRLLGYRSIEMLTPDGKIAIIPYSKLSSISIMRPAETERWLEQELSFTISSQHAPEKIKALFERRILEMPWVISGEKTNIRIHRDGAEFFRVSVKFYSLSHEMATKTEDSLQNFVNEMFG